MRPFEYWIITIASVAVFAYGFHLTDILADKIESFAGADGILPGWNAIVLLRFYSVLAAIGVGMVLATMMKKDKPRT